MNTTDRRPPDPVRCPHLGLHDDSSTALSYPSPWNTCYRAAWPASISSSHQAKACLGGGYVDCPMMPPKHPRYLPRSLRGRSGAAGWLPWLIVLLLASVLLILFRSDPSLFYLF
jgi:hypothetical protein